MNNVCDVLRNVTLWNSLGLNPKVEDWDEYDCSSEPRVESLRRHYRNLGRVAHAGKFSIGPPEGPPSDSLIAQCASEKGRWQPVDARHE